MGKRIIVCSYYLVSARQTHGNSNEILLSDVALHESIRVCVLEGQRISGILSVSIQSSNSTMSVILTESLETFTVSESSSDLVTKLVR